MIRIFSDYKRLIVLLLSIGSLYFWSSCAAVKQASGGPKDTTPPELILANPSSGSIHFSGNQIELLFNEYIDENSLATAIQFFPQLKEAPEIQYKGKKLIIHIPDSLKAKQTYVLSLNRNLKDEHGVPIAESIQVAFSTGAFIDRGELTGRIYDATETSVHLWRLDNKKDLSFLNRIPDYISDTNDHGEYRFQFLSPGFYQVMAVHRSTAGMVLVSKRMTYGFPFFDEIHLDSAEVKSGINMMLDRKELPLRLLRTEWESVAWGKATFSRDISKWADILPLALLKNNQRINLQKTFQNPSDSTEMILIPEAPLNFDEKYELNLSSIRQGNEALVDSGNVHFSTPETSDTSRVEIMNYKSLIKLSPEKNVIHPVQFSFSKPISLIEDSLDFFLMLSDSIPMEHEIHLKENLAIEILPKHEWEPEKEYLMTFRSSGFKPISGQSFEDSLISIHVQTQKYKAIGRLMSSVSSNRIQALKAMLSSTKKSQMVFIESVNSEAIFDYKKVPEGSYRLMYFSDMNGNNIIDAGRAEPFQTGEWFVSYPDTIDVRANWDMELKPFQLEFKP
ncbi:MAG: Ig-like domain-containing protein [Candidatus Marinimicrobia bacterium]|jgi:hypothetical protein|nr:Ig-like domain-containing protein [Candidatus Neomarinimicrobiota bacterium]MBT3496949.1 Ig-like domain-containing protein [Candidatus Neomarinimicrobiota bacterium]MBT3692137.1 Ig-like domain-containing protein [Candidatus Neomarinimicrobiota bacterium]MBT3732969.1 Ig-like domain-containing protein [Candidatus Neomarinimicrobiota bacterium]MBT4143861.1 Ig-like domain-containing protein [Candidatus Neomarinimicrobiota bacterium]